MMRLMDVIFRQMEIMSKNRIECMSIEYDLLTCRIGLDCIIHSRLTKNNLPSGVESAETCSGPDKLA